jgi:hypothetical protein
MKLPSTRGPYWPEASERTAMVMEKVVAATVMTEPPMTDSAARAPSAPPE